MQNAVITYLETGLLPDDDKFAKRLALTQSQYVVEDQVLYRVASNFTLRVVPPASMRKRLFEEARSGRFGAHLSDSKVNGQLHKHYRWNGMRSDISQWNKAGLVCATHNPGHAATPPLSPIPVSSPFDRVGVDVIQFYQSNRGNQHAAVFVD